MANLTSLTCDIPNSNNNWKWVPMTEDEYLLAQCRQHGYDHNSPAKVKLGEDAGNIFDRSKVTLSDIFEPPVTKSVVQIHNTNTKHNKASANFMHYAHTNLVCVLDIIDAVPDIIVAHLFPDNDHANQTLALEMLQALKKHFTMLCATDVIKITAVFDAPYDRRAAIDEYL